MEALIQHLVTVGGGRRVHLFWGARYHHELYDLPALHALTDEPDWIRFVPCVSEEAAMGGFVEAGTAVEVALRYGPWPDHEVYVCGSPTMVRETVATLDRAGVPTDRIHVDDLGNEENLP
jgi:NAD(P)H-flavin reductase